MNPLWLQVISLLLLSGFLIWKWQQRIQDERRETAARLHGHGFEATEIKARLQDWRTQHEQSSPSRRRTTTAHEIFVTQVRTSLLQLGFFHRHNEPKPGSSRQESASEG